MVSIIGILCICVLYNYIGTGKSETGAHLAYIYAQLNKRDKNKCVMYCGPSNKAVDVVLGNSAVATCAFINNLFSILYFHRKVSQSEYPLT